MVNAARAGRRGGRQKVADNAGVAGFPARSRFPANEVFCSLKSKVQVGDLLEMAS